MTKLKENDWVRWDKALWQVVRLTESTTSLGTDTRVIATLSWQVGKRYPNDRAYPSADELIGPLNAMEVIAWAATI